MLSRELREKGKRSLTGTKTFAKAGERGVPVEAQEHSVGQQRKSFRCQAGDSFVHISKLELSIRHLGQQNLGS